MVALAGGNSVATTVTALDRGALGGCRAVKEMVDAALVAVHLSRPAEVTAGAGELANGRRRAPEATALAAAGAQQGMASSTVAGLGNAFGPSRSVHASALIQ
jgi:hypothetical protein